RAEARPILRLCPVLSRLHHPGTPRACPVTWWWMWCQRAHQLGSTETVGWMTTQLPGKSLGRAGSTTPSGERVGSAALGVAAMTRTDVQTAGALLAGPGRRHLRPPAQTERDLPMTAETLHRRRPRLALVAAVAVALVATGSAYLAMVGFGTDVLTMTAGVAWATAG